MNIDLSEMSDYAILELWHRLNINALALMEAYRDGNKYKWRHNSSSFSDDMSSGRTITMDIWTIVDSEVGRRNIQDQL